MPSFAYKDILVTGGDGALGSYFKNCTRLSKRDLDVTNEKSVSDAIVRLKPKAVIHLAAITDMKLCEDDPKLARAVNWIGTKNVAEAAKLCGARLVYVSTNAVFDGTKDGAYLSTDSAHPINEYGKTKHGGELSVLEVDRKNLVVRSSWIFGGGPAKDKKFVGKIVPLLRLGRELRAVNDVWGTPTYGKDLADAIIKLVEKGDSGIVHIVNSGKASRYDMALIVRDALGSQSKIEGVPQSVFIAAKNALTNEMLDPREYALRPWQEALNEYIETEWK
jgi:dTDP-4-dehydrorhamnose reductase